MAFGRRYEEHEPTFSNPGSASVPTYSARFDDCGRIVLDQVGERNLFNEIQSYRDSCDLQRLLARYKNGETDVLSQVQGFYGDLTQVPKSFPEFFNLMKNSKQFYDGLPGEIKSKFGNSFESFMSAAQSPDFLNNFVSKPVNVPQQEEGSANES